MVDFLQNLFRPPRNAVIQSRREIEQEQRHGIDGVTHDLAELTVDRRHRDEHRTADERQGSAYKVADAVESFAVIHWCDYTLQGGLFRPRSRIAPALALTQQFLAYTNIQRRDLDEFVVIDEFERLLE